MRPHRLRFPMLACAVALMSWGCNEGTHTLTGVPLDQHPLLGRTNSQPVCHTIDFSGFTHGQQVFTVPSGFGFDLTLTVTPGGPHSTNKAVIYNTDNVDGPDTDLEWSGAAATCFACEGLGNVLIIEDALGFGPEGDSDQGGVIAFTGFAGHGTFFIDSFKALDQEIVESPIRLLVDGTEVGASTAQGDGSVEEIVTANTAFTTSAEVVIGGSGAVDDLTICQGEAGVGRMTGGGGQLIVGDVRVTRGFTIHCDIVLSNNVEVNWPDNKWHLDKPLTAAECIDDPAVDPEPPPAPFDTFIGEGIGDLNGVPGSMIKFVFVDSGEPGGKADRAEIRIWAPGANPMTDPPVLHVPMSYLDHGNLQAHYDQPHGNKPNK